MTELLTWDNALRMLLGIGGTLVIWTVGVTIGATVKWFRERVLGIATEDSDDGDPVEPPIPTSAH